MRFAATACLCLLLACVAPSSQAGSESDRADFSPAERLLFMTPYLKTLQPPAQLSYTFQKIGSLEPAFADKVTVALSAKADGGGCCDAKGDFLSGAHQQPMPEVPAAEGNPVILYFLEHDVREMKRLTGGAESYFRKRLRMAIYEGAEVRDVSLRYRGHTVQGQEIAFSPFLDDPNRARFEKFVKKNYRFLLSTAVPGGVYGIRTQVPGDDTNAKPLLAEELLIDGAEAPPV
ncbi:MAG: hypothetical protein LBQ32_04535 [Burkholderiaceae bacterium]|jgi:hypothetical protein|nr:hypothetical protein [Burkholderiaceae bacterium]